MSAAWCIGMARADSKSIVRPARPLRMGFLALTDAAPLIVAHERGLFRQRGLAVVLEREVGWATSEYTSTMRGAYGQAQEPHLPAA